MLLKITISSLLILQFLGTGLAKKAVTPKADTPKPDTPKPDTQDSSHYAILASKAIRVSSVCNITATVYNVKSVVRATFRLESDSGVVLVKGKANLNSGVTQIVSLKIPDDVPDSTYTFYCDGTGGLTFNNSHSVTVTRKTLSIFVQTDKAMYKPGQTVLFRVIITDPNLKPYQGLADVQVFDESGNKIMQWLNQTVDTGIISQQVPLSDQTPLGNWQIVVNAQGNTFTKTFQVAEYVLPRVQVTVTLPKYFLWNTNNRDRQGNLPITATAMYTYGQPVQGRATITVQVQSYGEWDTANYTQKVVNVQLVNGKADLTLTVKDLLYLAPTPTYYYEGYTPDPWDQLAYRTIIVVVVATETVTGIDYSGNSTVNIQTEKYQLNFLANSPSNYKQGLLYSAYFQLCQADGSAPDLADITLPGGAFQTITVQATFNYPPIYDPDYVYVPPTIVNISVTIPASGYMSFSLLIPNNVTSCDFQVPFYDNITNSTVTGWKSITAFKSRDNQTIQVSFAGDEAVIQSNQNAVFKVETSVPITVFQYEIMSKGNILLSDNVVGDSSTEHSFSIWISKDLAILLAPTVRILVWFLTASGEIVADSIQLSVSDIFENEVSVSFDRNSTTPATNVSVTVNAYPKSKVYLLGVDMSVTLLQTGNDLTQTMVSQDLAGYDSVSNDYVGPIMFKRRKRFARIWWPWFIDGTDSSAIIDKAGLFCLHNFFIFETPVYPWRFFVMDNARPGMAAPGAAEPAPPNAANGGSDTSGGNQPRVNFPETWIWVEEKTGSDGKVTQKFTAPDTITSWVLTAFGLSKVAGLGVAADTAQLTVFKPFFITPTLPYSVIRGEGFALQVAIFNYLVGSLDVTVTLKASLFYAVEGERSRDTQVDSNQAVSVYFWIVPGALGQIPIEISAQSALAGDAVKVMLLVKPEGVMQQYSTSTFVQLTTPGSSYSLSMDVSLPPNGTLVPGSEHIQVTVIGDLMGPSLNNLDDLLQMPYGCGEQNMLNLAPDVCILKYLTISGQLTADDKTKALGFINAGYQAELTYQRSDGSFSAFGNSDPSGSVWLSSFVIKVFSEAKDEIPVDDAKIAQSLGWIISNQAPNGSFAEPPLGRVIHTDMQGGSSQGLAITAYVFIALLQNRDNSQVDAANLTASISLARKYLEDQLSAASSDPYSLAIIAYAFSLCQSPKLPVALKLLENLAIEKAGTKHWEKPADAVTPNQPIDWHPPYIQAPATDIEMTSYVLLTFCQLNNLSEALPIAKWILAQRNANGGFSSTQDTVVGLNALTELAAMIHGPKGGRNLQVSLTTKTSFSYSFTTITDATALLLQSCELPSDTTQVTVLVKGQGSCLIQLNVAYNVYQTADASNFDLNAKATKTGNGITVRSCVRWNGKDGCGMVLMEVNPLSGYEVSKDNDISNQSSEISRVENNKGVIAIYFNEITAKGVCVDIIYDRINKVSNVKDASVRVLCYYDPKGGRTVFYSSPDDLSPNDQCPECLVENDSLATTTARPSTPCTTSGIDKKKKKKKGGKKKRSVKK